MFTPPDKETGALPNALSDALKRILRPLVRVMLARGLQYPAVAEMLKCLFVEIADKEFKLDTKRQTDSRVSLLSGVHRKDVKRLRRGIPYAGKNTELKISLDAQIIAAWNANPAYVDEEGVPKPLARFAQDGGEQSYEALVKKVSTDIHPRAVLDEWLRCGIAAINEQNQVYLKTEAFIPAEGETEKLFYFGHDLHDHAAASAHNMLMSGEPMLERCVHYDGLDAEAIAKLRDLATRSGMRALRAVNSRAAEALAEGRDRTPANPTRMTFGVYFYQEPQHTDETTAVIQEDNKGKAST
jgi:Family of unknown function (DUF6502)